MIFRGIFLASLFLSGCFDPKVAGVDVAAARQFYRQSIDDQQRTFRNYMPRDQLGLFFFGNQVRHPPALYLAQCFALGSDRAVDVIRSKLSTDISDLDVRDIAMLLATIDSMGTYDVAGDAELMDALRGRVEGMRDDGWRDTARRKVSTIGRERGVRKGHAPECGLR